MLTEVLEQSHIACSRLGVKIPNHGVLKHPSM